MKAAHYKTLNDFILEYENGRSIPMDHMRMRRYMGIEFKYRGVYYRMCREPLIFEEDLVYLDDDSIARYRVLIMPCDDAPYPAGEWSELVGWYEDIDDVVDHCIIQGRPFGQVIMDPETVILGQD